MCIYNTRTRTGLMENLTEMRGDLLPEKKELRELTDSTLEKPDTMSDVAFDELELYSDFD